MDEQSAAIWGGIRSRAGELLTVGPGEQAHARTGGASRSDLIWLPAEELRRYGRALIGPEFAIRQGVCRWLPPKSAAMRLRRLHVAIARSAATRPEALADAQAAHGLEQQVLHALIDCLSPRAAQPETRAARRHRDLMARFEELLAAGSGGGIREICAALGVSQRLLRDCCAAHLGMSPSVYRLRRAMQRANRALRRADPCMTAVAAIARREGFRAPGRFAAKYREIYGELPSVTLRRAAPGVAELGRGRPRIKLQRPY